jgi:hypothetical protein
MAQCVGPMAQCVTNCGPIGPIVTYGPMCKLKNKPLTKLLGPFFKEKWSETTRKQVFILCLRFGAILVPLNGFKKVLKGLLVGGTYGSMSKLKNQPRTKLLGPLF